MTEQEIIDCLKGNTEKGVAFAFMPKEVQEWCKVHQTEPIFYVYYNSDGWCNTGSDIKRKKTGLYALSIFYEPKAEFEAHYEEFEIDKNGCFTVNPVDSDYSPKVYHWWQWTKFLDDNFDKYNNFGGWVYEDPIPDGKKAELLVVSPRILKSRGLTSCTLFNNSEDKPKPACPTKILFWRYKE